MAFGARGGEVHRGGERWRRPLGSRRGQVVGSGSGSAVERVDCLPAGWRPRREPVSAMLLRQPLRQPLRLLRRLRARFGSGGSTDRRRRVVAGGRWLHQCCLPGRHESRRADGGLGDEELNLRAAGIELRKRLRRVHTRADAWQVPVHECVQTSTVARSSTVCVREGMCAWWRGAQPGGGGRAGRGARWRGAQPRAGMCVRRRGWLGAQPTQTPSGAWLSSVHALLHEHACALRRRRGVSGRAMCLCG